MNLVTVVTIEGVGDVVVTTVDFTRPGYELCGFETTTTLPDGRCWGCGPDDGESPEELHELLSDPATVAQGIKEVFGLEEDARYQAFLSARGFK